MKDLKIGVVGAGIQGISNALFLQKKGFDVTIFLFSRPYPTPRFATGAIQFSLYKPGTFGQGDAVEPVRVARWTFDSEDMAVRRFRGVIGDGYTFTLDLSDIGLMSIPVKSAISSFVPPRTAEIISETIPLAWSRVKASPLAPSSM